jgi:hypothetical protein
MTEQIEYAPVQAAEYADPIRYTDEQAAVPVVDVTAKNLIAKADAGAQLFYALYHHPKVIELFKSEFMTKGLNKAYMAACTAYLPPRHHPTEDPED